MDFMAKLPPRDLMNALKAAREQSQGQLPSDAKSQPLTSKARPDGSLTLEAFAKAFAKAKDLSKLH